MKLRLKNSLADNQIIRKPQNSIAVEIHPSWMRFIQYCENELGHGELVKLQIQDGLPTLAEQVKKKIRFN